VLTVRNSSSSDTGDYSKLCSDGNDGEDPNDDVARPSEGAGKPKKNVTRTENGLARSVGDEERRRGGKVVIPSDKSHAVVYNTFAREYHALLLSFSLLTGFPESKHPRIVQALTPQMDNPTNEANVSNAEQSELPAPQGTAVPDMPTVDQINVPPLPDNLVTLHHREYMWRATSSEPASPTSIQADSDGNADADDATKASERFALMQEEIERLKAELDRTDGEMIARIEQLQQRWRAEVGMMIDVERKMLPAKRQQAMAERDAALGCARMAMPGIGRVSVEGCSR
jgi:hypothetical protein